MGMGLAPAHAICADDVVDDGEPAEPCFFCGGIERLELLEAWLEDRSFMVDACCEAFEAFWRANVDLMGREDWVRLFAAAGMPVRGVWADSAATLKIDFGLELGALTLQEAKAFVAIHHRTHANPPVGWKWGHAVRNRGDLVGVAMVGRPVARGFDHREVAEVNRCCVMGTDPAKLAWNACSMLYGAAAREARRRGFRRIVTYITEEEDGTTLKAAGWARTAKVRARSWGCASRPRADKSKIIGKWRWERWLA